MAYDIKAPSEVKISSGILISWMGKYLLCHPSSAPWSGSFSPPKGGVEDGESIVDAAVREMWEETSIVIDPKLIENKKPTLIIYSNRQKKVFKKVYIFLLEIRSLSEIGLTSDIISKDKLQISEVDWCGFMDKKECEDKIFWRFKFLL